LELVFSFIPAEGTNGYCGKGDFGGRNPFDVGDHIELVVVAGRIGDVVDAESE